MKSTLIINVRDNKWYSMYLISLLTIDGKKHSDDKESMVIDAPTESITS